MKYVQGLEWLVMIRAEVGDPDLMHGMHKTNILTL